MGEKQQHKDHFIIGLTGNIGTGKSLVRKMLQHLGAYAVDADILTHQALNPGSPAHDKVVNRFGSSILDNGKWIDRSLLARIVFEDQKALSDLEGILHPLVTAAFKKLVSRARLPIIAIEAIKLLNSELVGMCDSIWVVEAQDQVIIDRLAMHRGMDQAQIMKRLSHQSPAEEKRKLANVVIDNSLDVLKTWCQVEAAWEQMIELDMAFSKHVGATSSLFSSLDHAPVTPSSEEFQRISSLLDEGLSSGSISWLSGSKSVSRDGVSIDIALLICSYFLFAPSFTSSEEDLTIWDLTQFECSLVGCASSSSDIVEGHFKTLIASIEQFGQLHMVNHIKIPLKAILKERQSFLEENGFILASPNDHAVPQWNKAGYNLYMKQVSDAFGLFI
jgi:dephospho-CoA kinase